MGRGYFLEQATRPQTIGQSLADSPVGLAAWMIDHDARSYEQIAHVFAGPPEGDLTRDDILDSITLSSSFVLAVAYALLPGFHLSFLKKIITPS